MGKNFHKIEAVRLKGGDPPSPPQAVSLTAFFPFFFDAFPNKASKCGNSVLKESQHDGVGGYPILMPFPPGWRGH